MNSPSTAVLSSAPYNIVRDLVDQRDHWRGCPVPNCPQATYTYSSRHFLWLHLHDRHGAKVKLT